MTTVSVRDLVLEYRTRRGTFRALDGVSFDIATGEVAAIVGESGSGKSTLAMALARLLPSSAHVLAGAIRIGDREVLELSDAALSELRRTKIGYIFQDPTAALDPTMKIGRQVRLALSDRGIDQTPEIALKPMRFTDVSQVAASYPHEISGGMAQRVGIAMTLARRPHLIIADEPTAALDASVKAEVLDLLVERCRADNISLLLVTHDLTTVRRHTEKVAVMYAGRIIENGAAVKVFDTPRHPYTRALFAASVGQEAKGQRLVPIPGLPPILNSRQTSCAFAARCQFAVDACRETRPEPEISDGRQVVCLRLSENEILAAPA